MDWIESSGGPVMVIRYSDLPFWSADWESYDRASSVSEVGALEFLSGDRRFNIVSLWGEPMATTYDPDLGMVIQWGTAPNEQKLMRFVRESIDEARWQVVGRMDAGAKVVMDAAVPGPEVSPDDVVEIGWDHAGQVEAAEASGVECSARLFRYVRLGE